MKRLSVSIEVCRVDDSKLEVIEQEFLYILFFDDGVGFKMFRKDDNQELPYVVYDGEAPSIPEAISSMSQYAKRALMADVMQYMTTDIET